MPVYYESQGQPYMAVMNINRVHFCCLYGNNEDEVIICRIDRDMDYEMEMIALEEEFWKNHVQAQESPPYFVQTWREIVPPTEEGILQYLSSGLLKGIGKKTSEAIVQKFGADSLNILEKLLEIKGITPERLEEIKAGYAESTQLRGLMTTLAPFKITPSTAVKILDFFGPNSVGRLRESPYRLCQIPGFGFERVDAIVRKSGGDLCAPFRIQGAIFYTLDRSRNGAGHLYMDAGELVKAALFTLNSKIPQLEAHLNSEQIIKELTAMIQANIVVCNQGNIYLPHVFAQERETARKIASILLEKPKSGNYALAQTGRGCRNGVSL